MSKKASKKKQVKKKQPKAKIGRALLPRNRIVTLPYAETEVDHTGTGFDSTIFNANSIYDPWYAAGGHSCYMNDTFATMYNKYEVISCSILVRFVNQHSTTDVVVGIKAVDDVSYAAAGPEEMLEDPAIQTSVISAGSNGYTVKVLKQKKTTKEVLALAADDDQNRATMQANPNKLWHYQIMSFPSTGTGKDLMFRTWLQYRVRLADPIVLGTS